MSLVFREVMAGAIVATMACNMRVSRKGIPQRDAGMLRFSRPIRVGFQNAPSNPGTKCLVGFGTLFFLRVGREERRWCMDTPTH